MRFGHTCVVAESTAIVFGGSRGAGYFNDLHCLDVQSWVHTDDAIVLCNQIRRGSGRISMPSYWSFRAATC